jgi:hypothetical protein
MEVKKSQHIEKLVRLSGFHRGVITPPRERPYQVNLIRTYVYRQNIHVSEYRITILDENRDTLNNAISSMINRTIYKFPNSRVRVVPLHDIIYTKHK